MAVMKTVDGIEYPSRAFLVVGDPESPTTWHLRVRNEAGEIDHRLMGAAWAALHGGYRGNVYEGPDKGAALDALKALYEAEEMPVPTEKMAKTLKQHTGTMVSWKTPEILSQLLRVSAERSGITITEPIEEMHLTLAYTGEMSEQQITKDQAFSVLSNFAAVHPVFSGEISGMAVFEKTHIDGMRAVVALVDSPYLPEFRQALVDALSSGGISVAKNHGYTPHITIAYIPEYIEIPVMNIPVVPIEIEKITLNWGDDSEEIQLSGSTQKEGKRNAASDQALLNKVLEMLIELGAEAVENASEGETETETEEPETDEMPAMMGKQSGSFAVYKSAAGDYRWLTISSSAYQDRDGQWVTQKALATDVARANADKNFGPLRYAHVGYPDIVTKSAGPGLDLGDCDFNTVYGPFLVEGGTFRSKAIGEAASKLPPMGVSIGFFHPTNEPQNGAFSQIHRFERSLLPAGRESNPFTSFLVLKEQEKMTDKATAKAELTTLLGASLADQVTAQLETKQADAESKGVTMKERIGSIFAALRGDQSPAQQPAAKTIGEMSADEFTATIKAALTPQAAAPVEADTLATLKESAKAQNARIAELETTVKALVDELEALVGRPGYRPTKDAATVKAAPDGAAGIAPDLSAWLNGGAK